MLNNEHSRHLKIPFQVIDENEPAIGRICYLDESPCEARACSSPTIIKPEPIAIDAMTDPAEIVSSDATAATAEDSTEQATASTRSFPDGTRHSKFVPSTGNDRRRSNLIDGLVSYSYISPFDLTLFLLA